MKLWLFIFFKAIIIMSITVKDRYLHIKIDNSKGNAKLKDHIKYSINKKLSIEKILIEYGIKKISNIEVTVNDPHKISNFILKKEVFNSKKSSIKLKNDISEFNNSILNKIQFDVTCSNTSNEDYIIITIKYEISNFFESFHEEKKFSLDFDLFEKIDKEYQLEIKMDVTQDALFGNDVSAQLSLDDEENLNWKIKKDRNEIHSYFQYKRKNNHVIKGSFQVSNFNRNDKFSFSHSNNNNWDFNDWYHHHGHSSKNYDRDQDKGGNIILEMGFAFILLFGIFACIFSPIVCINDDYQSNDICKCSECFKKEFHS